jgi:hypothetical protein
MEAISSSETSVLLVRAKRRHIPEDKFLDLTLKATEFVLFVRIYQLREPMFGVANEVSCGQRPETGARRSAITSMERKFAELTDLSSPATAVMLSEPLQYEPVTNAFRFLS